MIGVTVDETAGSVTITLEEGVTYNLRLGRVDLGATQSVPTPKYITKETSPTQAVKGDAVTLTVQVRDAYKNGVANASVVFEATTGVFGDGGTTVPVPVSATGRATVEYVPATTGSATVTAAIPGTPSDLTVVTWALTVSEFGDTSDGGINPAGGTALALDHVQTQGGAVVLTFRNFDPNTDRTITDMRVNFYSTDSQGGPSGAYDPPTAVKITAPVGVDFETATGTHRIGDPFEDLTTPWTVDANSSGDLTLQFFKDADGTTPESVEKGGLLRDDRRLLGRAGRDVLRRRAHEDLIRKHAFLGLALNLPSMQGNLPPEAQEKLEDLQDLQDTAQQVAMQKQQAETQLNETETALDELETLDEDTTMYREVGELFVKTDYETAESDLEEKQENLEIRVQTLEKQENRVREQFQELQEELQEMLGGGAGGPGGAPGGPGPGAGG